MKQNDMDVHDPRRGRGGKAIGATPRMIQLRADVPISSRLISSDLLPVWWER
jgi:hypothetical protein